MAYNAQKLSNFNYVPLSSLVSTQSTVTTCGTVFVYSNLNGDIDAHTQQGFYAHDTRFLSKFKILVNDKRLRPVGHASYEDRLASFYCRVDKLSIVRDRFVSENLHEEIYIANYSPETKHVGLKFIFDADFADIFEIRRGKIQKPGTLSTSSDDQELSLVYRRINFIRETKIRFSIQPHIKGKEVDFQIILDHKDTWKIVLDVIPLTDQISFVDKCQPDSLSSPFATYRPENAYLGFFRPSKPSMPLESIPTLMTDSTDLRDAYYRAVNDLRALRLEQDNGYFTLAAGLPWFMAVFGRDSIISTIQTKLLGPELMIGTLKTLAKLQANNLDLFREAEPGKIIHEVRKGELSFFEHVPHSQYYGSIDSTPLFLILLWETFQWTGDMKVLHEMLPHAELALAWIDEFGDFDKDGFVEYKRHNIKGLKNQGWKDSGDSISFSNGTLARGPIALVEVQGYVYDAQKKMAEIYKVMGNHSKSQELSKKAENLKERFNDRFWIPKEGYFAVALDGEKRQVDSITSNPGHCLWSGIIENTKASKIVDRLLASDMFNGWGIRTLSSEMKLYDPLSYHNGSIWPHDNSLIVAGLIKYGYIDEAFRVIRAIIDATSYFPYHRLPELFSGYSRREYSFPVPYPFANAPQAWASGSIIYFLECLLRVIPSEHKLMVDEEIRKNPPLKLSNIFYRGKKQNLPD